DLRFQKEQYRKRLQETIDDLLPVAREIPAPGVMYSKVTVREAVQRPNGYFHTLPSYSTYEFETFKPYMAGMVINSDEKELNPGVINGQSYSEIHKRDLTLKDYTSRVGNLKKVTLYNHPVRSPHQSEIVSETYYHYLHDEADTTALADQVNEYEPLLAAFKQQGVIQETYLDARVIEPKARRSPIYGIVSRRHTYPSIKTGETVVNHRTGITTNTRNLAYDFYSGAELKTLSEDGLGNHYVTEKLAAYQRTPYSEMGLMIDGGKNMLTQQAGSYTVKVKGETDLTPVGLVSAEVQTWSNKVPVLITDGAPRVTQDGVWRKEAMFNFNGTAPLLADGTYPYADFTQHAFDYTNAQGHSNPYWEQANRVSLYNYNSHALEAVDINEDQVASRMDPRQFRVLATVANASYDEVYYSGAEYYEGNDGTEGGVSRLSGAPTTGRAHSGSYSLITAPGREGFEVVLEHPKERRYRASVWAYLPGDAETPEEMRRVELYAEADGVQVASVSPEFQENKSKNWYLMNLDIDPPPGTQTLRVSVYNDAIRAIYLDDFRVHPQDAVMTSYVYNQRTGEVTYILDKDNLYTQFEYDAMGRLTRTYREIFYTVDRVLNETIYHYSNENK
ncbi:MAG: hypothetical protein AAGA66_20170, partial [Bacteroidota bacterium]